jgi:ankyrin repeat protein
LTKADKKNNTVLHQACLNSHYEMILIILTRALKLKQDGFSCKDESNKPIDPFFKIVTNKDWLDRSSLYLVCLQKFKNNENRAELLLLMFEGCKVD